MRSNQDHHDEIDLSQTIEALRRAVWLMLLVGVLVGTSVYFLFKRQTPIYASSTMILSAGNQTGNQTVNSTLVSAPPLPPGALEGALVSPGVLRAVRDHVDEIRELSKAEQEALRRTLTKEAALGKSQFLRASGQADLFGNGTYLLTAEHPDPRVAARLANIAAEMLVEWDRQRGLVKVTAARQAIEEQLQEVTNRIQRERRLRADAQDMRVLLTQESELKGDVNSLRALEKAVVGSLSVVAEAVPAVAPERPRPLRNAVLAGVFALLATGGMVVLRASLRRTVSSEADLRALDLRLVGEVIRLRGVRRGQSVLAGLRRGRASDGVAFLGTNVTALLASHQPKVLLVTSLMPGEGKSSLCGALADYYASSGLKTLLIDTDLRHPTQQSLWGLAAEAAPWINLPGAAPFFAEEARDLQSAIQVPQSAQAKKLRDDFHLVVPGPMSHGATRLHAESFVKTLKIWQEGYDIVVIDAPPALAVADPLTIAPFVSGVLLVLEPNKASLGGVQRLVDVLTLANANIVGVAFNKISERRQSSGYGYGYGYDHAATAAAGKV